MREAARPGVSLLELNEVAATVIGRPRIEPELSISSVTTVSRNFVSRSILKDSGCIGSMIMRGRRAVSR